MFPKHIVKKGVVHLSFKIFLHRQIKLTMLPINEILLNRLQVAGFKEINTIYNILGQVPKLNLTFNTIWNRKGHTSNCIPWCLYINLFWNMYNITNPLNHVRNKKETCKKIFWILSKTTNVKVENYAIRVFSQFALS